MTIPEPATTPPEQRRRRKPSKPNPVRIGNLPSSGPTIRRKTINVDRTLAWISSVGKEDDASELQMYFQLVCESLKRNGMGGNKNAIKQLPEVTNDINFNGDDLLKFLADAGTDDISVLQKLYAAMRLRVRHAAWVTKRRKK